MKVINFLLSESRFNDDEVDASTLSNIIMDLKEQKEE